MAVFTVGDYLAQRLVQVGIKQHFVVPGDYNLVLLDKLQLHSDLSQVGCANELNCAFAAEGYARARGFAACIVTFSVGALSAFNGVGSAYAEDVPLLIVSGSPNTNDTGQYRILHHTLGKSDLTYQLQMAEKVTCCAVAVGRARDAPELIDRAIRASLMAKKPAYIEIPTNLSAARCVKPGPISAVVDPFPSDKLSLTAAVDATRKVLSQSQKPIILIGPGIRGPELKKALLQLAEAIGCAVVVQPAAKGFFPESHSQFAGVFWGQISTLGADSIFNWADIVLCVGTLFSDYSTVGWTTDLNTTTIQVEKDRVVLPDTAFGTVQPVEFLLGLTSVVNRNETTALEYSRFRPDPPLVCTPHTQEPLTRKEVARQVQSLLTGETTVFVDTGDSWFNGVQMQLPPGARFEIEMQWGHIGWSIPAAFGYALANPDRQVVVIVGDGALQVTVQEISQMIRHRTPIIIILMNNQGYTIEVEIHDGLYNRIQNWNYAGLIQQFNSDNGHGIGLRASTGGELADAMERAKAHKGGPILIECMINQDDCSKELITWGHYVAAANARPPRV